MRTNESQAAAVARIAAGLAVQERHRVLGSLRCCFARTGTWLHAGKYVNALASELSSRNGWSIAEQIGDRTPDRTQRLLNRASWDEMAAMSLVRRHVVAGLDQAAQHGRHRRLAVGALDETGQEKQGSCTAGVKRQYMGCAGRVANGINTVHLSYVRDKTGHALIGARQWIPAEDLQDPVKSLITGLPVDLRFRTKGQLAIDVLTDAYADAVCFDVVCGDEVYGSCTELRQFLEEREQAYVLRVASSFPVTLAPGVRMTCAGTVKALLKDNRHGEVRSAGTGSQGERWYAWSWIATDRPRHHLLVRRHLTTGQLAFHYCFVPAGQVTSMARLIRAAGLRWPVEEGFEFGKDYFGLDQCQARLYTAILRHTVLVMLALAICALTAARLRHRTDTQAPPPRRPDQPPPRDPGLTPLTVHDIQRLLAAALHRTTPDGHLEHWLTWRRRHQARARWYHQRTRLSREYALVN
ncbi:MAG TPA: IS701 family transposase [Actinocrinis sp.]